MRGSAAVGGRPIFLVVRGPLRGVVFSSLRGIVGPLGLEAQIAESVERVAETLGERDGAACEIAISADKWNDGLMGLGYDFVQSKFEALQ